MAQHMYSLSNGTRYLEQSGRLLFGFISEQSSSPHPLEQISHFHFVMGLFLFVILLVPHCTAEDEDGFTNVALGKNTTQSTTNYGGVSSRAVDGNTDGNWRRRSCTHTKEWE